MPAIPGLQIVAAFDAGKVPETTSETFDQDWSAFVKSLGKDLGRKGKRLFQPLRLAVTGAMSGTDIATQLRLVSSASSVPLANGVELVSMSERMETLRNFLATCDWQAPEPEPEEGSREPDASELASLEKILAETGKNPLTVACLEKQGFVSGKAGAESKGDKDRKKSTSGKGNAKSAPGIQNVGRHLDLVVGKIVDCWPHEDSDKLFCEKIDIGEEQPREIASGLREFYELDDLKGRMCVVLANLKERPMGGFKSKGMVLCASDDAHKTVKFLEPPADAKVGDRVVLEGLDMEPMTAAQVKKKKILEAALPDLKTMDGGVATYNGMPLKVAGGVVTAPVPEGYQIS